MIIAVSALGVIASIPGQTIGVSVFTESLTEAIGISRKQLSSAFLFGTVCSSLVLPFAGRLIDRFGGRIMATVSAVMLGLACIVMSRIDKIALYADRYGLSFISICLCFMFLRFAGQGCMTMSSRVTMARWFEYRRGMAAAISGVLVSFFFNSSPKPFGNLVAHCGWSKTYVILGLSVGIGMTLIAWIFFRDNPEQCNLQVDGPNHQIYKSKSNISSQSIEFTRAEAIKTYEFWVYTAAVSMSALLTTSISFHTQAIGEEAGLTASEAFGLYFPMSFFSIGSNLIGGYFSDHAKMKNVLAIFMASIIFALFGTANWSEPWGRMMFISGFGISGGLFNMLRSVAWARFFGRKHLGAINGLTMPIVVVSTSIGPFLFSVFQENTGGYKTVLMIMMIFPAIILLLGLFAGNPQDRYAKQTSR